MRLAGRVTRGAVAVTTVLATGLIPGLATGLLAPAAADRTESGGADRWPRHSSDGQPGETAERGGLFGRAEPVRVDLASYEVAPGLQFEQWDMVGDGDPYRVQLLTADLSTPGLGLSYASMPHVAESARLKRILSRSGAVAGVNADFFDIHDTQAPLGVGVADGVVRHGPRDGWTMSFLLFEDGRARVRRAPVTAHLEGRPGIRVTNVNSPHVPVHGIGLYTPAWGIAPGYRVVDGARHKDVRQVVVRRGRVVSNSRRVTVKEPVRGRLLIGRGGGSVDLKRLRVGSRVRIVTGIKGSPVVAVSGSEKLLAQGEVRATDDKDLHPRTAIGVDRDTGRLLLVVVDGRQEFSRGLTLVELAELLRDLGAEEALNLDGGGSSTMVARPPEGEPEVVNSPSDGRQRKVPNGLALTYAEPTTP